MASTSSSVMSPWTRRNSVFRICIFITSQNRPDAMRNPDMGQSKLPAACRIDRLSPLNIATRIILEHMSFLKRSKAVLGFLTVALVLPVQANEQGVIPGIEVLLSEQLNLIRGKRVGLITNHSGVNRKLQHDIDLLSSAPGVKLTALF